MMRRIIWAVLSAASVISLSSCEEIIEFNGKYDGEKLVLFSCANPDASQFSVSLSRSRFFLDASDNERPYDITGGEVTLTVEGKTMMFTEDSRLPGTFHIPYLPLPGSKLVLNAKADGLGPVTCETVVPARVKCEVVPGNTKITGESEWGITVEHHFIITVHDNGAERNFYRFIVVKDGADEPYYDNEDDGGDKLYVPMSLMTKDVAFLKTDDIGDIGEIIEGDTYSYIDGVYDDSRFNGKDYTFDAWVEDYIWKSETTFGGVGEPLDIDPYDISGWGIEVDAVSEDLYKYQRSREDYSSSDSDLGGIFSEPVSIHSNIIGGIGCFGAITPNLIMF